MSASPSEADFASQAQQLYQALLDGDPTAPDALAVLFLPRLTAWLEQHNPRCPPEFCLDAAADALLSLCKNPAQYNSQRLPLEKYLHMAARGDLLNRLSSECRQQAGQIPLEIVEHSPEAGKYLGREEDPSLALENEETTAAARQALSPEVLAEFTAEERKVLELLLQGERKTAVFAQACGVTHLPPAEQRAHVKRVKDRVKVRLKRGGEKDARTA